MLNLESGSETSVKKVSWLKRDVLLFNTSIGCRKPRFLYERHENFAVFPTYPLALIFKQTSQDVIDFYSAQETVETPSGHKLNTKHLVDGQRAIEILKPLPVASDGYDFEFRSRVLAVYDKGSSGTVVKSEDVLVDAQTDCIYARVIGSMFYVGQGNWGGLRGPKELEAPHPKRDPDSTILLEIPHNAAHLYRLNGDYNPLHAIEEVGQGMGYGGIIVHGVYTYNRIAYGLVQLLGNSDPTSLRQFQAKFTGPVRPKDKLRVEIWHEAPDSEGWQEIVWVATVIKTGKVCLRDGKAQVRADVHGKLPIVSKI